MDLDPHKHTDTRWMDLFFNVSITVAFISASQHNSCILKTQVYTIFKFLKNGKVKFCSHTDRFQMLSIVIPSNVTLSKLTELSVLQFLPLWIGRINSICFIGFLPGLIELQILRTVPGPQTWSTDVRYNTFIPSMIQIFVCKLVHKISKYVFILLKRTAVSCTLVATIYI